jgi:hypothetical protein
LVQEANVVSHGFALAFPLAFFLGWIIGRPITRIIGLIRENDTLGILADCISASLSRKAKRAN